eukprot:418678-Prymnesium_polylepis.1
MQDMLVDVMALHDDGQVSYYEELPRQWAHEELRARRAMTIEFRYANKHVWNWELLFDQSRVSRSPALFLHPVVTAWHDGAQLGEPSHALEDVRGEWRSGQQIQEVLFALFVSHERLLLHDEQPDHL